MSENKIGPSQCIRQENMREGEELFKLMDNIQTEYKLVTRTSRLEIRRRFLSHQGSEVPKQCSNGRHGNYF